jgi:transcription antitermination factor NusG
VAKPVEVDYGAGHAWFVVRTNPRCEARAMATLGEAGFETFFPTGKKLVIRHRTKKAVECDFPLLVGYLFLAMPSSPRLRHWGVVRECHGVRGVLGHAGTPVAVSANEVDALRTAEAEGRLRFHAARSRPPHGFDKDQQARITLGPFTGFVGQVADASSLKAIRLLISLFGRLTEVSVPVDGLEAV